MSDKVLVAYGSKHGMTAEIAERIGKVVRAAGFEVDVVGAKSAGSPVGYRAVILGSGVYAGMWRREASRYLKAHEADLAQCPVWLFSSGPTGAGDLGKLLAGWSFPTGLRAVADRIKPRGVVVFRGARNDRLGPINLDTIDPDGEPEGGNILLLFNLEATIPSLLVPMKNLYYTFFADVGNVFAKSSDFNPRKLERALGFGLKYRTPLGPIRLDFAFNLRKAAEKNFLVFVGIGNVY